MIDYICVGLVACYMTYQANRCTSRQNEQTGQSEPTSTNSSRRFLRLL